MRTSIATLVAASILAASPALAQSERPDGHVRILIGERIVLPDEGISSYSESGPGTFDVEFERGHIVLIGRMSGRRTILLIFADGTQRRYDVDVRAPGRN